MSLSFRLHHSRLNNINFGDQYEGYQSFLLTCLYRFAYTIAFQITLISSDNTSDIIIFAVMSLLLRLHHSRLNDINFLGQKEG